MLAPKRAQGLTGLELVDAVGWPYHGRTVCEYNNGAVSRRLTEGQSWLPSSAAPDKTLNHFPIHEVSPISPEWGYHFLYGYDFRIGDGSQGEIPCALSASGGDALPIGIPLKVGGQILRIAVLRTKSSRTLTLWNLATGATTTKPYSLSSSGPQKYVMSDLSGRVALCSLAQIDALPKNSTTIYTCTVLDHYENKALIALELTRQCDSLASIPDDRDHSYLTNYLGIKGDYYIFEGNHSAEVGRNIIAVFELVANSASINDVSVSVIYNASDTTGLVTRESPANQTQLAPDHFVYGWKLSAVNAVVDAWYTVAGAIQSLRCDILHNFKAETIGTSLSGTHLSATFTNDSTITLRRSGVALTETVKHEWKWLYGGVNNSTVTIWRNSNKVSEVITSDPTPRNYGIKFPWDRAPWAGDECRMLTLGRAQLYDASPAKNPELYTIAYRNNGSKTSVLSTVVENNNLLSGSASAKKIYVAGAVSKSGLKNIANFTDTVVANDTRYVRDGYNVAFQLGYVGAITRAVVNPVTGELSGGAVARPISYYNFR